MYFSVPLRLLPLLIFPALTLALPTNPNPKPNPNLDLDLTELLQLSSNDILDPTIPCKPLTHIHAHGWLQLGNVGFYFGDELCRAVNREFGEENVAIQGVDYPLLVLGATEEGKREFVRVVEEAGRKCGEKTKIVVTGYSLGAYYAHASAPDFPANVSISSAVTFGDMNLPNTHQPLYNVDVDMHKLAHIPAERYRSICNEGDYICEGKGGVLTPNHLMYHESIPEAVKFIRRWFDRDVREG